MSKRLQDKVAVITGACSGIGLATVERFIGHGALVVAGDIQDEKGAALEARFPGQLVYRHCDVTDDDAVAALIAHATQAFGGLDILFNNAGSGGAVEGLSEMSIEGFDRTMALLLRSVVSGTRHAVAPMVARGGGAIINTSSVAAFAHGAAPIAYSTAKAGVLHFSKLAAAELGRRNIRVNAVAPGLIATSIFGASIGLPRPEADQMAAMIAGLGANAQPLPKPGLPEDVADAVVFLASDESRFVTGAQLLVDGGLLTGPRHSWDLEAGGMFQQLMQFARPSTP